MVGSPIQSKKQGNRKSSGGWGLEVTGKMGGEGGTKFEKGLGVVNIGGWGGGGRVEKNQKKGWV